MKILHVSYVYYPDAVGGTEVYVAALARHLMSRDHAVVIVAPGSSDARYVHDGIPVRRFPTANARTLADMYGSGTESEARAFLEIVGEERPDIVHLHAGTAAVGLRALSQLKRQHIPIVLTHHVAAVTCQRGTLMKWGREVCDGRMRLDLCTRCTLQGLGLPRAGAALMGRVPVTAGRVLAQHRPPSRAVTALRMRELVALRHASLRAFLKEIDHIVAVCNWSKRVLIANDIPDRKISVSRHALTQPWTESEPSAQHETTPSAPLRLAYIGRLDPIKGVDTVIRAVRSLIDVDIELHIHGVVQNESGRAYHEDLRSMSMGDPRIVWERTMQSNEVVSVLRRYDVLVVPSRALETGPLVVLEAFAAGIPVIGSNLGGIAELVEHDVNGLLVPPSSVKAWGDELRRLVTDPELLARLTAGVRPPRRMEDVATEMVNIYQTLILRDRIDQRDVISL